MSNSQISTFDFKSHPVRVELFKNEPHFCLTDVCSALEISNATASRFRFNEKGLHKMYTLTNGGKQELMFINEPNLYRIIFRSNKKEAVEFQNWVFEEVLPQIRKTGKYEVQPQQLALPEPNANIQDAEFTDLKVSNEQFEQCKQNIINGETTLQELCDGGFDFSSTQYDELEQIENERNGNVQS